MYFNINSDYTLSENMEILVDYLPGDFTHSKNIINTGKKLYLLGYFIDDAYSNKVYSATINNDGSISKFTLDSISFPTNVALFSVIKYKNKLFTFGSANASGQVNSIYMADIDFNGVLGSFTAINSFISMHFCSVIVCGNYGYIMGGVNNNNSWNSNIYKFSLTVGWGLYSDSVYNNNPELYKYTTNLNLSNSNPLLPTMVGLGGKISSIITNGIENQLTTNITYSIDSKYNIKQSYNDILNIDSRDFSQKISNFHLGDSLIKIGETKVYY
jgi:hypothetical protein